MKKKPRIFGIADFRCSRAEPGFETVDVRGNLSLGVCPQASFGGNSKPLGLQTDNYIDWAFVAAIHHLGCGPRRGDGANMVEVQYFLDREVDMAAIESQ